MSGLILLLWGFVRGGGIMAKRADAFGVRGRNRRHAGGAPEVAQYEEYRDWVNTPRPPMEPFEGQRRGMEERFARQDARNPEERSADRPLIEGLQSGALVEDSPVPGRPRVRTKEESEAAGSRAETTREAAVMALLLATMFGGAIPGALAKGAEGRGLIGGIDRWEARRRAGMFGNQPLTQGFASRVPTPHGTRAAADRAKWQVTEAQRLAGRRNLPKVRETLRNPPKRRR